MSKIKLDIDGVIFDLGSTLLEYETIPWNDLNAKCIDAGYEFLQNKGLKLPSREEFWEKQLEIRRRYREKSLVTFEEWRLTDALYELLLSFNLNGGIELAENFFNAFYKPVSKQLTIFADTHDMLGKIKQSGKKIGLVSNTIFPEEYHMNELKYFGLLGYFDYTIFSVTFGFRKPHPSIYKEAVDLMNLSPDRLLFVGDRYLEDVKGPIDFGMKAVLKYREGRDYPDPIPKSIIVVESLTELTPYIL